ncbi:MAG: PH domain-containing protein [Clostridia bacterium]|nr:PH domain-containing protein [Clostridia bacterium]
MFSKPTRNHITIILEQIGAVGVVLITGAFSLLFDLVAELRRGVSFSELLRYSAVGRIPAPVNIVVALLLIVLVVWLILRWSRTVFYIESGYLIVEKRTLMHRSSRLPLSSISTVNLERSLFERIVGTAKIKLDINSAATANKTDFIFVLPLAKAKAFEQELTHQQNDQVEDSHSASRRLVCSFTVSQVIRDVILGQPIVQILIFFALLALGIPVDKLTLSSEALYNFLPAAALAFLSWGAGIVAQFMSAYGFKVERDDNSFFITSGLLKKKQYVFDKNKVNAVIVRRPLLARFFGYYRADVAVVGLGNDKHETPQICLLVKKQELDRILSECAPDFMCSAELVKSHKAGLVASLGFYLLLSSVVAVAVFRVHFLLSIAAVLLGTVFAVLSYHSKKLAADDKVFSYSRGLFTVTQGYFRYNGIQTAGYKTNILFLNKDAGKIRISILSSSTVSLHTTGWFDKNHYESLVNKLGY